MEIRTATVTEAKTISEMIRSLSQQFFSFPDGKDAEGFLRSIGEDAVAEYITGENFSYYVGEEKGKIVGAIAIRDNKHLYHLFVLASCQGRQLGRQLWEHAKAHALGSGNRGEFTVNSSLNAVPVYHAFGFEPTSQMRQANGISFFTDGAGESVDDLRNYRDIDLTSALGRLETIVDGVKWAEISLLELFLPSRHRSLPTRCSGPANCHCYTASNCQMVDDVRPGAEPCRLLPRG